MQYTEKLRGRLPRPNADDKSLPDLCMVFTFGAHAHTALFSLTWLEARLLLLCYHLPSTNARDRAHTCNGDLGALLLPRAPLDPPRLRDVGSGRHGAAPEPHGHRDRVLPGAPAHQRLGVRCQRALAPRRAPLCHRADRLRFSAFRRQLRPRLRSRPLLRRRHVPRVRPLPVRRGHEPHLGLRRRQPPPRRHLERRLLRLLRRHQRQQRQRRRLPRACHLRPRRRARQQRLRRRPAEARRRRAVSGAVRGREREYAGRRGLDRRGELLRREEHGARAGAVREGLAHGGGVRTVHRVLGARGGDVLLGPRPLARRRGSRRPRLQLLPPLRGLHCAGAPARKARDAVEQSPCIDRAVGRSRRGADCRRFDQISWGDSGLLHGEEVQECQECSNSSITSPPVASGAAGARRPGASLKLGWWFEQEWRI